MKKFFLTTTIILAFSLAVLPTNGINLSGTGAKSTAMGGADVAWINDINALNINPAGLAFAEDSGFGIHVGLLFPTICHSDVMGNQTDAESAIFPLPNAGYLHKFSPKFAAGLGVFTQGGMGVEYESLNTAFMTSDMIKTQVMHMKLIPGLAFKISDKLAIGGALEVSYSQMTLQFFPETSAFAQGFLGMDTDDFTSFSINFKAGAMFKASESFSLGIAYQSKTDFEYDGTMAFNFSSMPGMDKVTYDAAMTKFNWPAALDMGVALTFGNLTVAADATLMMWEDAVNEVILATTAPAGMPDLGESIFYMKWEDRWVFSFGIDYKVSANIALQAGFNYSENPVPTEFTTPLFPAIVETHISAGCTLDMGSSELQFSIVYVPEIEVVYTNMTMPFGPGAKENHSQFQVNIGWNIF